MVGKPHNQSEGRPLFTARLCFLLDITGSMAPELTAVKEKLAETLSACTRFGAGKLELQVAFVGYRDIGGQHSDEILPAYNASIALIFINERCYTSPVFCNKEKT